MLDHEGSPTRENEISENCMAIITKYWASKVMKTKALLAIFRILNRYTDEGQRDKAAETYVILYYFDLRFMLILCDRGHR